MKRDSDYQTVMPPQPIEQGKVFPSHSPAPNTPTTLTAVGATVVYRNAAHADEVCTVTEIRSEDEHRTTRVQLRRPDGSVQDAGRISASDAKGVGFFVPDESYTNLNKTAQ